jgi:hypothetical protein
MSFPLPTYCKPRSRNALAKPPAVFVPSRSTFGPSQILALKPAAWFRLGMGITVVTGVSQWSDQSGNGRHLLQATAINQPALQTDGSILFDGVGTFLKCSAFTLNQPETIYILFKSVSWTSLDYVCDGNAVSTGNIVQFNGTPNLVFAAALANIDFSGEAAIGTYCAMCVVFNGASSVGRINNTEATGNPGAANMGGFSLGSSGAPGNYSNIQVKEVIIFPSAHDSARRASVIAYLMKLGNL